MQRIDLRAIEAAVEAQYDRRTLVRSLLRYPRGTIEIPLSEVAYGVR